MSDPHQLDYEPRRPKRLGWRSPGVVFAMRLYLVLGLLGGAYSTLAHTLNLIWRFRSGHQLLAMPQSSTRGGELGYLLLSLALLLGFG